MTTKETIPIITGIFGITLYLGSMFVFAKSSPATSKITQRTADANYKEADREDIFAEVENSDMTGAGQLMMWALRSNPNYKWVELRGKPGSATTLLVVRHTMPKYTP